MTSTTSTVKLLMHLPQPQSASQPRRRLAALTVSGRRARAAGMRRRRVVQREHAQPCLQPQREHEGTQQLLRLVSETGLRCGDWRTSIATPRGNGRSACVVARGGEADKGGERLVQHELLVWVVGVGLCQAGDEVTLPVA